MKAAIVNDTTKPHFGCQLVMQTFREQLDRVGIELIGTVPNTTKTFDDIPFLDRADLVIVNGEGTIHHKKGRHLVELAARYPAVLINCVYQEAPLRPEMKKFKYVAARESLSAAALREHGVPAEVVPDVIFSSKALSSYHRPEPQHDLGFSDNVTDVECGFSAMVGLGQVTDYLDKLSSYKRLCLGRFHSVVAASVLGIPFSAWPSNTHKTEGLMQDMGISHLFAKTQAEAAALAPETLPPEVPAFVREANVKINRMFERLHEFV